MPLPNDLLNPISPDSPAGENLRYAPIYDKIREARREDDNAPQGEWKRERKAADWPLTVKLIGETLATRTKDLQLAAWLAEAMLRREGVAGLGEVLGLIHGLIESFWEGLYPELEDGDAEFRAAPLQWTGDRLEVAVKEAPLTRGGLNWLQYRESRAVGSEAAADTYDKQQARQAAIGEGKLAEEVFDQDFDGTPKKFYADLEATYDGTLETLGRLADLCNARFADASPSFNKLKAVLEEVRQTVHILLEKKREKEPDEVAAPVVVVDVKPEPEQQPVPLPVYEAPVEEAAVATPVTGLPRDWDDAAARVAAIAKFLRQQDPYSPAPYLMLRGLRWGELRAAGATIDQTKLAPPPSEIRRNLKRLAMGANWTEVLETAETAMAMECGRGWLDLQRYVGRACQELGSYYEPIRVAIVAEWKALLADYPQLPELTMMDDTPTANAETLAWIRAQMTPPPPAARPAEPETAAPDAFELAMEAARSGRAQEAIELLMREMRQESSGRGRFQRKVQVAQLCVGMGNEAVALPILEEAVAEIERRRLEDWEDREWIAHPLAMLYRCLAKMDGAAEERQKLYSWICRLDPVGAMNVAR